MEPAWGSGGDNWSYKMCKAPAKSSPPTNQHPAFHRLDALPVAQPSVNSTGGNLSNIDILTVTVHLDAAGKLQA